MPRNSSLRLNDAQHDATLCPQRSSSSSCFFVSRLLVWGLIGTGLASNLFRLSAQNTTDSTPVTDSVAIVRHAPNVTGRVRGSIRQLSGENVLLGSGAFTTHWGNQRRPAQFIEFLKSLSSVYPHQRVLAIMESGAVPISRAVWQYLDAESSRLELVFRPPQRKRNRSSGRLTWSEEAARSAFFSTPLRGS